MMEKSTLTDNLWPFFYKLPITTPIYIFTSKQLPLDHIELKPNLTRMMLEFVTSILSRYCSVVRNYYQNVHDTKMKHYYLRYDATSREQNVLQLSSFTNDQLSVYHPA